MIRLISVIFLLAFLAFGTTEVYSQKITKSEIDEFTNHKIVETSWHAVYRGWTDAGYARFRSIDNRVIIDFSLMFTNAKGYIISTEDRLMLKLGNDTVIKLNPIETAIPCRGCCSTGFKGMNDFGSISHYSMSNEQFNQLLKSLIVKVRIYTGDGYIENEVKPNRAKTLFELAKLLINN